jgi:glyoxylase-like metal-dependent hydrolase (beta-lactamase superfamily II)
MRVRDLPRNDRLYSSNVYLVLGDWSKIDDVNTLVDAGADPAVMGFIDDAPTGVGKKKVDLVILTHHHYDHALMLPAIRAAHAPGVAAWGHAVEGVDLQLTDGQRLHVGDGWLEVIHTPAHTDDSICLYSESNRALFVGDTPVIVRTDDHVYSDAFVDAITRIAARPVDVIYFGHGDPLTEACNERLQESLVHLRRAAAGAR